MNYMYYLHVRSFVRKASLVFKHILNAILTDLRWSTRSLFACWKQLKHKNTEISKNIFSFAT